VDDNTEVLPGLTRAEIRQMKESLVSTKVAPSKNVIYWIDSRVVKDLLEEEHHAEQPNTIGRNIPKP
jgi:hypothetical protein